MSVQNEQDLIESNTGLVISIAKHFKPRNPTELDEYVQLGRIGLLKAIRKYDPEKSKLSTYAWYYIHGEISKHITSESRRVHTVELTDHAQDYDTENILECFPNTLTEIESEIINMRLKNHSFAEIGKFFGRTRFWANKNYNEALNKIRNVYEEENSIRK